MAQQQIAGLAVVIALTFLAFAISACATSEQLSDTAAATPSAVVAIEPEEHATPEFHGADIGSDFLRSRLHAE